MKYIFYTIITIILLCIFSCSSPELKTDTATVTSVRVTGKQGVYVVGTDATFVNADGCLVFITSTKYSVGDKIKIVKVQQ